MKILVLNLSPRGENSITLQTSLYLERCFPEHTFRYLHAGQRIKALTRDFAPAAEALREAELIVFSYPVYTFIAPSQLHFFLRLMKESGIDWRGKAAVQITTSKHFYDVTAHRCVRENLQDMGMRVIRGLSADMEDLTRESGRRQAESFFRRALFSMENGLWEEETCFAPEAPEQPVSEAENREKKPGKTVAVVADLHAEDTRLKRMIDRFRAVLPYETKLVNIAGFRFDGGCLGCLQCAADGKCVYRDGFDSFLRQEIQTCDGVVYAFRVQDHSMGPVFKCYDDRQFCNGHRTVTMGSPIGYLAAGDLMREENLRLILDGRAQVGGNYPAGYADDRHDPDRAIDALALSLADCLERGVQEPQNYLGVGGSLIFRDLIWQMRGLMKADHRFYREHGMYKSLPHRKLGTMAGMLLVGQLMKLPQAKGKMNEGMLAPYKKAIDSKK